MNLRPASEAALIEKQINENFGIQRCNHPDSEKATAARIENEQLFAQCEANGWAYREDRRTINGHATVWLTIIENQE